jgi:hypothetical protein
MVDRLRVPRLRFASTEGFASPTSPSDAIPESAQFHTSDADDPADFRRLLHSESAEFETKVTLLREEIRQADVQYENMRSTHEIRRASQTRRRDQQNAQIDLLSRPKQTFVDKFDLQEHSELEGDKDILESQLSDLNSSIDILTRAILIATQETAELQSLMAAIPSANPEIVEITRRQIKRRVQSEADSLKAEAIDTSEAVAELESEIQLSRVIASGLEKENREIRDRIPKLRKQCQALEKERDALVSEVDESATQMPLSDLDVKLKETAAKIQNEVAAVDGRFKPQLSATQVEIRRLTNELETNKDSIEFLNVRIQELTAKAHERMEAGASEIGKWRKRNQAEIDDITQRGRAQFERALSEQRKNLMQQMSQGGVEPV